MTVHSRRASREVLDRFREFLDAGTFILHWFSGSTRDLDQAIDLDCWFSVGPGMLRGEKGRALVARMPRERVLTESDGPFAQLDDGSVFPWQMDLAIDELSKVWSLPREAVDQMLWANFRKLIGDLDSPWVQYAHGE